MQGGKNHKTMLLKLGLDNFTIKQGQILQLYK